MLYEHFKSLHKICRVGATFPWSGSDCGRHTEDAHGTRRDCASETSHPVRFSAALQCHGHFLCPRRKAQGLKRMNIIHSPNPIRTLPTQTHTSSWIHRGGHARPQPVTRDGDHEKTPVSRNSMRPLQKQATKEMTFLTRGHIEIHCCCYRDDTTSLRHARPLGVCWLLDPGRCPGS